MINKFVLISDLFKAHLKKIFNLHIKYVYSMYVLIKLTDSILSLKKQKKDVKYVYWIKWKIIYVKKKNK